MKKTIEEYLKLINPKNEREVFVALTHLSLVFFETDNNEGVRYLAEDLYNEMISKGYGFTSNNNKFTPSVVEFGELVGFMLEDIQKFKNGKFTKEEARKSNLWYLKNYIYRITDNE